MDDFARSVLAVARARDRSVVTRARSVAPLRLWAPRCPGEAAWVYQASLGGGLVGRDAIALDVEVDAGARLFLTSQASNKVYRQASSRVQLDAAIADRAILIAWPDPIVCFAGAALDQRQRFDLTGSAGVISVDAWTAGRVAHGERWAFARLALRTELSLDGAPLASEAMLLDPAHGDLSARMAGADACATVIIAGPAVAEMAAALTARIAALPARALPRIAASAWPWGCVLRVAAASTEQLTHTLHDLIGASVRHALGADPFTRKW